MKRLIQILALILFSSSSSLPNTGTYIRINQLGYHPSDPKTAIVISNEALNDSSFQVVDSSGNPVFEGKLSQDWGRFLSFDHNYRADFSALSANGTYQVKFGEFTSPFFRIGENVYESLPDSLLRFLRVQRCGYNNPLHHQPCHLRDASRIIGGPDDGKPLDLTGGWHDAGDYIKFLLSTSYSVYLMLLAYEMNPHVFVDSDADGLSDLLDEARIGLDWMMKMHYEPDKLLIQVQDLRDHNVGWRLPEDDTLMYDRPAYFLPSRVHCGSFAAAMALAHTIFLKAGDPDYAKRCLKHAVETYDLSTSKLTVSSTGPDSIYYDQIDWDNRALAAVELFRATGLGMYLREAIKLAWDSKPVHWFSWGDMGALVYYRLAEYDSVNLQKLEGSLNYFDAVSAKNPFGYPLENFPWGSASIQMGAAAMAILHCEVTDSLRFLPLAVKQRDFILGKNSHGVSFIGGFGTEFPTHFHHQISFLKGIAIPGGFAEGYISTEAFNETRLKLRDDDRFAEFQSEDAVYHDDYYDYLCNEATISSNALALFVFSWFAGRSDNQHELEAESPQGTGSVKPVPAKGTE